MRTVLFTGGAAGELRHIGEGPVRVVVRRGRALPASIPVASVLEYSTATWPLLWLRLMLFLGFRRGRVIASSAEHSGAMKLLAASLRGRFELLLEDGGAVPVTLPQFLWLAWKTFGRRPGPVCLVGTAGQASLVRIAADLRRCYPGVPLHAFVPTGCTVDAETSQPLSAGALLRMGRGRFATVVIPWTGEGFVALKALALLLPLGYHEIYNENGDFCSAREFHLLLRHMWWRLRDGVLRAFRPIGWALHRAPLRLREAIYDLEPVLFAIPKRVTVLAAAPPATLAQIVEIERRRRPDSPLLGLLPRSLASQAHLFDSATVLRFTSAATYAELWSCMFGRRRAGYFVMPFTGEGHTLLKLVFWFLPLGRREFHNEHGNFAAARSVNLLLGHLGHRIVSWFASPPPRITVLGSASGYFLKAIVADLRRRYPGAPLHGLLPPDLVLPASRLFDTYTVVEVRRRRFWREVLPLAFGSHRSTVYAIPCTNELRTRLKVFGFLLPLGSREIYNENADAYRLSQGRMLARHTFWRLGHSIVYQALTERNGRLWPLHILHLLIYPARLIAGAVVLASVRLRVHLAARRRPAPVAAPERPLEEDLIGANVDRRG